MRSISRRDLLGGSGAAALSLASVEVFAQTPSDGSLARLQAAKKARIGIANQPPFSSLNPDGSVTGVAPTITKAIMRRLGVPEVEGFLATYGQLIPGMLAGRWDFVSASMTITKARCDQVQFSDPIVFDGDAIVGPKGKAPPHRIADLAKLGEPIGVEAGGADLRLVLAAGVPPANIRQFPSDPAMMDGLLANRISYSVIAHSALISVLQRRNLDVAVSFPIEDAPLHASAPAFRKQDRELYEAYQTQLRAMKASGEYLKIIRQFGYDALPRQLSITAAQACSI
jgi:polar amino acid transport system substrate-binding protein